MRGSHPALLPLLLALSSAACGAPPVAPAPTPQASATPALDRCAIAKGHRDAAEEHHRAGRLWAVARLLRDADKICPEKALNTAPLRARTLAYLGASTEANEMLSLVSGSLDPAGLTSLRAQIGSAERDFSALDPDSEINTGIDAIQKGQEAEGRRRLQRALARIERDSPKKLLHVDVFDRLGAGGNREPAPVWMQDGRILVTTSEFITVFDAARERVMARIPAIGASAISPDGRFIVNSASSDVVLFDVAKRAKGPPLEEPKGPLSYFDTAAFSHDGRLLAAARPNDEKGTGVHSIVLWSTDTGRILGHLPKTSGSHALVFSPSGALLAAGDNTGDVDVWEIATRKRLLSVPGWTREELRAIKPDATEMMGRAVQGLAFSPDEAEVLWVSSSTPYRRKIPHHKAIAATPPRDSVLILRSEWTDSARDLRSLDSIEPLLADRISPDPRGGRYALRKERTLSIASRDGATRLLTDEVNWRSPNNIALSKSGEEIVLGTALGHAVAWPSGRKIPPPETPPKAVSEREILAPFGLVLKKDYRSVETTGGEVIASCEDPIRDVAVSLDRRLLALVCRPSIRIYDIKTPGRKDRLVGWIRQVWTGQVVTGFVPEPKLLVSTPDGRIELFGTHEPLLKQLSCQIGYRVLPFAACEDRVLTPGLLAEILRGDKAP